LEVGCWKIHCTVLKCPVDMSVLMSLAYSAWNINGEILIGRDVYLWRNFKIHLFESSCCVHLLLLCRLV